MASKTNIEWTATYHEDGTVTKGFNWNFLRGCSRVSEGCRNCYAERQAARFAGEGQPYEGLVRSTPGGPKWTGEVVFYEHILLEPLKRKTPTKYFVNSMSDLFHENVTDEMLDKAFAVMALTPQHTYQILTKRPERMRQWFETCKWKNPRIELPYAWPLTNVWFGVSVEDQKTADERIPLLLETPAAVRWVSAEPLLGPIDIRLYLGYNPVYETQQLRGVDTQNHPTNRRVGDSGRRHDLEVEKAGMGSLAQASSDSPVSSREGGKSDGQKGIFSSSADDKQCSLSLPSASSGLVSSSRPDSRGPDGQSQERRQDRQQTAESRIGDGIRADDSRIQDGLEISGWTEESGCQVDGQRSSSDSGLIRRRASDTEGNSGPVQRSTPNYIQNSEGRSATDTEGSGSRLHPSSDTSQQNTEQERSVHLNWAVIGGESGPNARPFDIQWARSVIEQCKAADVPVFVKQLGKTPYVEGVMIDDVRFESPVVEDYNLNRTFLTLTNKKGGDPSEWPEDLRVREFPK